MNAYFRREIAEYANYHRDWWNCAMHVFGIVFLFTGSILPLSLWPVSLFGVQTTVATIAVLPVLAYWLWLDFSVGLGILGAAIIMLATALMIVNSVSPAAVWSITAVLIVIGFVCQFVGHKYFERRQPALKDNPTHLLLGPMFVMAKLFIALGFRSDIAALIEQPLQPAPHARS